jgi:hypothetical protein
LPDTLITVVGTEKVLPRRQDLQVLLQWPSQAERPASVIEELANAGVASMPQRNSCFIK